MDRIAGMGIGQGWGRDGMGWAGIGRDGRQAGIGCDWDVPGWFLIHYFILNFDKKWLRYRKDRPTDIVKYRVQSLKFFFGSRLGVYHLESHHAKFQSIPMKNG